MVFIFCLKENEMTIRGQAKDLEQIMNDRDIIGAQLVRRNDELGLLYEKINILQITLRRGTSSKLPPASTHLHLFQVKLNMTKGLKI